MKVILVYRNLKGNPVGFEHVPIENAKAGKMAAANGMPALHISRWESRFQSRTLVVIAFTEGEKPTLAEKKKIIFDAWEFSRAQKLWQAKAVPA